MRPLLAAVVLLLGCGRTGLPIVDSTTSPVAVDAGAPDLALVPGIVCGSQHCAACADQFCDSNDYGVTGTCRAHVAPTYLQFGCDGPEDCPAAACCLTDYGSGCSSVGFCTAGSVHGLWMCHVDADCGTGFVCCDVRPSSPYRVCKPSC